MAIRDSGNVSRLLELGQVYIQITLQTAMPDADYATEIEVLGKYNWSNSQVAGTAQQYEWCTMYCINIYIQKCITDTQATL